MSALPAYKTIREPAVAEMVVKKSRFIGSAFPVASVEEAHAVLTDMKKRYHDATHNCSAVICGYMREYTHCSDDGEPSGTAGVPMLEALKGSGLTNVLVVATRYFGGTLLGTGGLVRAYTGTVQIALEAAQKVAYEPCTLFQADFSFKSWGRVESGIRGMNTCGIVGVDYADKVTARVNVASGAEAGFLKLITELTNGSVTPADLGVRYVERSID